MGPTWPKWTERNSGQRWARSEGAEPEAMLAGDELGPREGTALGTELAAMEGTEETELGAMLGTPGRNRG